MENASKALAMAGRNINSYYDYCSINVCCSEFG